MTYAEQLKDPRWQKKRLKIMERDFFSCTYCGDEESQLNVHHGYYEKNKMAWEYENFTLHTLCSECHEIVHAELNKIKYLIGCLNAESLSYVISILEKSISCPPDFYSLCVIDEIFYEARELGLKTPKNND